MPVVAGLSFSLLVAVLICIGHCSISAATSIASPKSVRLEFDANASVANELKVHRTLFGHFEPTQFARVVSVEKPHQTRYGGGGYCPAPSQTYNSSPRTIPNSCKPKPIAIPRPIEPS